MDETLMKLVSVAEMRAIEAEADRKGMSYAEMMENAGRRVAEEVIHRYEDVEPRTALALVGPGNNGGDALVALAALAENGWSTRAYLSRARQEGDELVERARKAGAELAIASDDPDGAALDAWLEETTVLLDGVLGTGATLPLKPEVAALLGRVTAYKLNAFPPLPHVVAVDCPSGVDCDTGEAAPECIPADVTLCMEAVKIGLLKFPANALVGELEVVDLDLPEGITALEAVRNSVVGVDFARAVLPDRPRDSHKGTFGTAMVIAGSLNYTGAAYFASKAAYLIGAGLVRLAAVEPLHPALAGHLPEVTWVLLPHDTGVIHASAADVVIQNLDRITAVLIGPGLGSQDTTAEFIDLLIAHQTGRGPAGFLHPEGEGRKKMGPRLPGLVVDADGLRLLAKIPNWPKYLADPAILTPHPGEMAVLTGIGVEEIQRDRIGTAARFAQEWGQVVVLKGAMTVIASPDGRTGTIPVATPALARAGTGDVLAGILVGLRAQRVPAYEAALLGCWIHAQAGIAAGERVGHPAGVLASDVLAAIPEVLAGIALS